MASPATSTTAPWPRTWDLSLKLDIPAETKAVVEKARKEIDDLLAKRGKK